MYLQITNQSDRVIEVTNGKQKAYVAVFKSGAINVLNANAAHRAFKGIGRHFWSWDEAIAGYKSAFMKNVIELARDELVSA